MIDIIQSALTSGNVKAFLQTIRWCEGTTGEAGYCTMFGGKLFDSFADHPRIAHKSKWGWTSAAGAYQFMVAIPGRTKVDTWTECVRALDLPDFSPASQDLAAVYLIHRRGALDDVIAGRIEQAIAKTAREWASLPGSPYGQPTKTLEQALAVYAAAGGSTAQTPPKEAPVAPFIAAALPAIINAVPSLIRVFGDSPTAERNAKAAELVVEAAKQATGARNEQEVVEILRDDPSAAKAVSGAVQGIWYDLVEVGGGVEAARAADIAFVARGEPAYKSPAFLISLTLLLMPFMLLVDVFFIHAYTYSDNLRTQIVTGVLLVVSLVGGYWLGSSAGSARKTELSGGKQ